MKYSDITARLIASGIERDEARFDAAELICFFCGVSRASVLAYRDADYSPQSLEAAVVRRENREPLAYITGTRGFMGVDIAVTSDAGNTLIPRPETELIAEYLAAHLPKHGCFADICCGSGCIGAAVCAIRGDVTGIAVDVSEAAVAVTNKNIARLGLSGRLDVQLCDLRDFSPTQNFDMIAANPPYLTAVEMGEIIPELTFEPALALDGGSDGLELVRVILAKYPAYLKSDGEMLVEIGAKQGDSSLQAARSLGLSAKIIRDYSGLDRVLHVIM